jgi:hypothetical protein
LLAVTACAGNPMMWDKPGATQSEFNKDKYECAKDGFSTGGSAYMGFGVTERTFNVGMAKMCMQSRGYALRPAKG